MDIPLATTCTLVKNAGQPSETRQEVEGSAQHDRGYFPAEPRIEVGDIIESGSDIHRVGQVIAWPDFVELRWR